MFTFTNPRPKYLQNYLNQCWIIVMCTDGMEFETKYITFGLSPKNYYDDVMISAMASQIISFAIVYPSVYSGADQRKHQSSASLAFVRGIHRWPVNSPHKGPVTQKMFPFDDFIMSRKHLIRATMCSSHCNIPYTSIYSNMVQSGVLSQRTHRRLVVTYRDHKRYIQSCCVYNTSHRICTRFYCILHCIG